MHLHVRRHSSRHRHGVDYHISVIALFSPAEAAVVDDNNWWGIDLYQSQHLLDLLEQREAIAATPLVPLDPELTFEQRLFKASYLEQALWKGAKLLWNGAQLNRAHRITVADLHSGITLSGDLDDITMTDAIITKSCEILDAKLNAASSFNGAATVVGFGKAKPLPPTKPPRRLG